MSALHRSWVIEQAAQLREHLALDIKQAQHLNRMFRIAGGRCFPDYEQRLDELYRARKRINACRRRLQALEKQL